MRRNRNHPVAGPWSPAVRAALLSGPPGGQARSAQARSAQARSVQARSVQVRSAQANSAQAHGAPTPEVRS